MSFDEATYQRGRDDTFNRLKLMTEQEALDYAAGCLTEISRCFLIISGPAGAYHMLQTTADSIAAGMIEGQKK